MFIRVENGITGLKRQLFGSVAYTRFTTVIHVYQIEYHHSKREKHSPSNRTLATGGEKKSDVFSSKRQRARVKKKIIKKIHRLRDTRLKLTGTFNEKFSFWLY